MPGWYRAILRYRAPGLFPAAPELLRPSCGSCGRLKPVGGPPALSLVLLWKAEDLRAAVLGWLPSRRLPLVLNMASPAKPPAADIPADAMEDCFWRTPRAPPASGAEESCGSCEFWAACKASVMPPALKYGCSKTFAAELRLFGSHCIMLFMRAMPSALDCGTIVSSLVGTNWGKRKPIWEASLKPSCHWLCVGVPSTEQIL
mmetsp:Transcript_100898/g.300990  ORF Transcript_100898/g.300990 Transcript_100898/m.300990 type:complete len:202 (+) Transcript_100898:187-792(+)